MEQTHEALLGLQPATCLPSDATVAAAADTVLERVRLAAARLSPAAGGAGAHDEGDGADSTHTKAEQKQNSSTSAAGPQQPQGRNAPIAPTAPGKEFPLPDFVGANNLAQLSSTEAAALLDLDLALLQRLVQSESAASVAADFRSVLLAVTDPSGGHV